MGVANDYAYFNNFDSFQITYQTHVSPTFSANQVWINIWCIMKQILWLYLCPTKMSHLRYRSCSNKYVCIMSKWRLANSGFHSLQNPRCAINKCHTLEFYDGYLSWKSITSLIRIQGPDSILRCHLTSIGNPIVEMRRSSDRLISTMGSPILVRCHLYIESWPRCAFFFVICVNVLYGPICNLDMPNGILHINL